MIIACNFITYDVGDFEENKIAYRDDINNAPSLLTPGAIDVSEVCSVIANADDHLNLKLGQASSVHMKSGYVHVVDVPTKRMIDLMLECKEENNPFYFSQN